jgi:glycine cleavage system aminomethyltransferase T
MLIVRNIMVAVSARTGLYASPTSMQPMLRIGAHARVWACAPDNLSSESEMMQFQITPSARLRPSPFFEATVAEGVTAFTTYNHMLMPTGYGHPEQEYWRLIQGVSLWDVACERQVELRGKDAGRLAQLLTVRDIARAEVGQGKYAPLCNHTGTLINDPILLKLAEDRYWFSIADSNIWFWARAVAAERGLDVEVGEPDVSPLAIQGPKAEDVAAAIFGDRVRALKYFWFLETTVQKIPVLVARSGWSKQGGFELYLKDGAQGKKLWQLVREAGKPWDIGPGTPNLCERIESGLLSYGGDTDETTTPFEVRLEKYVNLELPDEVIGISALRDVRVRGPKRHQLGVILEGDSPTQPHFRWSAIQREGRKVGDLTNCTWSYRLKKNIGFALIAVDCHPGEAVQVAKDGQLIRGTLTELPFI